MQYMVTDFFVFYLDSDSSGSDSIADRPSTHCSSRSSEEASSPGSISESC